MLPTFYSYKKTNHSEIGKSKISRDFLFLPSGSLDPQIPGYFEDLNTPASYRFIHPSIEGSKILRVVDIIP